MMILVFQLYQVVQMILACNYNSANTEDNTSCSTPTGCQICSGETRWIWFYCKQ